ncbi:hypothetical protein DFH08DRAFT_973160 [Mycena albidolilacea]|uniref:Uncharacterized protein n=1 Tax=Mycena albidolilacea TaxID=1033008 RepID=A0AAD6Z9I6_9AGAR|nr:hypothetical protein DFH08DRAFT_973160 [Mycena albidolilacea]
MIPPHYRLASRLFCLFAFSNLWQLALASLYPTCPTSATSFRSGALENITWTDMPSRGPHLSEMGDSMRIDLCNPNGTFVAILAEGVSPESRSRCVEIPRNLVLPETGRKFVIQFIAPDIRPIWTADFRIMPETDSIVPYPQVENATATNPLLTLVLPTTTLVTELRAAATVAAATTVYAGPLSNQAGGAGDLNRVHQPNSANPRKRSEYPNAKLRLLFIVWPALVGISMAL